MATPELLASLLRGETDRVEFKQSSNNHEAIARAVCALANDLGHSQRPGYVIVGIDKHGAVIGADALPANLDEQQRVLADRLHSSRLFPTPAISIGVAEHGGRQILVLEVTPYAVPPVVQLDGVAWVRVGSTTRRATPADIQRLAERRPLTALPYDARPINGTSIADLELGKLEAEWRAAKDADEDPSSYPELEAWLGTRQLVRRVDGRWTPNAAALLLHGKSPQDWIPGAQIDLVRYSGVDVDAPVATRRRASGTLPDQLEVAWAWVSSHLESTPTPADGIREGFVATYPLEALKELTRNLVQHRSYDGTNALGRIEWFDDRIEFSNPGGPFGRASEGEFGTHSEYRNPLVTDGLLKLGYVQQLGRGVRRARLQLEKNGNPPLEVETDGFTRVIVRRR